jgi:hypothetical protein
MNIFTEQERDILKAEGRIGFSRRAAYLGDYRIEKVWDNDFAVESLVIDPDGQDYWELYQVYHDLKQAIEFVKSKS